MKKMTTRELAFIAMFSAMVAVLGYIALDFGNLKITFESLPVIVGAFMFGPIPGMIIGGIGTFIYQILKYGLSATTLLWILPYVICGLIVGLIAKMRNFKLNNKQIMIIIIANELLIFLLNTAVIYIDSKIYYYYSFAYVFGSFFIRLAICIGKSIVFGLIVPVLLIQLKRVSNSQAA